MEGVGQVADGFGLLGGRRQAHGGGQPLLQQQQLGLRRNQIHIGQAALHAQQLLCRGHIHQQHAIQCAAQAVRAGVKHRPNIDAHFAVIGQQPQLAAGCQAVALRQPNGHHNAVGLRVKAGEVHRQRAACAEEVAEGRLGGWVNAHDAQRLPVQVWRQHRAGNYRCGCAQAKLCAQLAINAFRHHAGVAANLMRGAPHNCFGAERKAAAGAGVGKVDGHHNRHAKRHTQQHQHQLHGPALHVAHASEQQSAGQHLNPRPARGGRG